MEQDLVMTVGRFKLLEIREIVGGRAALQATLGMSMSTLDAYCQGKRTPGIAQGVLVRDTLTRLTRRKAKKARGLEEADIPSIEDWIIDCDAQGHPV